MHSSFAGKKILVGVTGSIAAFKVAGWVSTLAKAEAEVSVIMTRSAREFVSPLTFSALSGNPTYGDMFAEGLEETMHHITLGRDADLVIVAPATAGTIARLAAGMADDLLTTTILASRAPVMICPAMNSRMYLHPATRENIARLKHFGYQVIAPEDGLMACKEEGPGRLPEWEQVCDFFLRAVSKQDLLGEKVLITAGPTREPIDPARFLSNRSSGKMGYAMARTAFLRGAEVQLVSGPVSLACPVGVQRVSVQTARQMHEEVLHRFEWSSIVVKAAAVADFRPAVEQQQKMKKDQIEKEMHLLQNPDILHELGRRKKEGQILVGFAAESANLEEEGRKKLARKNLDMIAVNNICSENTGFECDSNQILLIDRNQARLLPMTGKEQTADMIWDRVVEQIGSREGGASGDR
jgi:phosphopantothenoylcysteine decarboxylase/phosphopantothenate--cysteine ligase